MVLLLITLSLASRGPWGNIYDLLQGTWTEASAFPILWYLKLGGAAPLLWGLILCQWLSDKVSLISSNGFCWSSVKEIVTVYTEPRVAVHTGGSALENEGEQSVVQGSKKGSSMVLNASERHGGSQDQCWAPELPALMSWHLAFQIWMKLCLA